MIDFYPKNGYQTFMAHFLETKSAATWIAGISGCLWGLLGAYFSEKTIGTHVWFAAPLGIPIGITVFFGSRWTYEKSRLVLFSTTIVSTLIGTSLFGVCVGLMDLMRDIPNRSGFAVVIQSMLAYSLGLLTMPPFWAFFLLSFGNHALLRVLIHRTSKVSEKHYHASAKNH